MFDENLKRCREKRCGEVFSLLVGWKAHPCEDESKRYMQSISLIWCDFLFRLLALLILVDQ